MSINTNAKGNIELKIQSGKGLSHVIDAALDDDIGSDVKLNRTEWNSVFSLIKANQVETNKDKFTDKDTDIANGRHYRVTAGTTYEIKATVWSQIVEIGRNALNRNQPVTTNIKPIEEQVVQVAENGVINNSEEYKANVQKEMLNHLKSAGYVVDSLDDGIIEALTKYYGTTKRVYPNISDAEIQAKLTKYADGLRFHSFGLEAEEVGTNGEIETKASKVTTNLSDQRDAYIEMGEDYVSVYDAVLGGGEKQGEIELHEMFMVDLIDYYQREKGLDRTTAQKYAIEAYNEYKNQTSEIDLSEVDSKDLYKATIFDNALRKMKALDYDGNGTVSAAEAALFQYGTAHINDKSNKITADEIKWGNLIIQSEGLSKEEIMNKFGFDEQQANNLIEARENYKKNNEVYASFIIDGNIPS